MLQIDDLILTPRPTSPPERNYALRVGEKEYWDEAPLNGHFYWSNLIDHSDWPNAKFLFNRREREPLFVTTRPVKEGEEVFIKYDDYHPTNPTYGRMRVPY